MHHGLQNSVFYMASAHKSHIPRPRSGSIRQNEAALATKTGLYAASPRSNRSEKEKNATAVPKVPVTKASVIPKRMVSTNPNPAAARVNNTVQNVRDLKQVNFNKQNKNIRNSNQVNDKCNNNQAMTINNHEPSEHSATLEETCPLAEGDAVVTLKSNYEEKLIQFDHLRKELKEKQKKIIDIYGAMRETHEKMASLGHQPDIPPAEQLSVLNIGALSPEQLFRLCAGSECSSPDRYDDSQTTVPFDVGKLNKMSSGLVSTCEQALNKRKEIIDWLDSLVKSGNKGIKLNNLVSKVKEFSAENEMLSSTLIQTKASFLKDLSEILSHLRKGVNDAMSVQIRNEELMFELSDLESQNANLKKQVHTSDYFKSNTARTRIEELEKELKEEKCKKIVMKDRLSRAEGQVKIGAERAGQLEAALEQARSQAWSLERTVQQLHEQNQKLQSDFDKELSKLTESIRENTVHLEDIADAREKLQAEKEDLERRLQELSENYNESIQNMKHDLNANVAKVIESEKKINSELEEKKKLEHKVESLCAQLLESELRYKDLCKELQDRHGDIQKMAVIQEELDSTRQELEKVKLEVEEYKHKFLKQIEAINQIEFNLKEHIVIEDNLKHDLNNREEYIAELEKKIYLLEEQMQISDQKMELNENQLTTLRNHIKELQEDIGKFENLTDLRDMINQIRSKLIEATKQNDELAEGLLKKDEEIEQHLETLNEQAHLLDQKDGVIKMLSDKENEQAKIINLLRHNMEIRNEVEQEFQQKLNDRTIENESLLSTLETRKQQIAQLEKIILTLEDQTRKLNSQKRLDKETIRALEKKIKEYDTYYSEARKTLDGPDNLEHLIKILEDELQSPLEPKSLRKVTNPTASRNSNVTEDYHIEKKINSIRHEDRHKESEHETMPTKIVLGNFIKKTYNITPSEGKQPNTEKLDRKKAITNIDTQKNVPAIEPVYNVYTIPLGADKTRNNTTSFKNLPKGIPNMLRDEKKYNKMFKFAGHRL